MPLTHRPRPSAVQSPLEIYLHEINATPLLSAAEERELAYRVEDGDLEARDHLVRANLRLVVNLARRYAGSGLAMPDLIAEGNLGLLRAAEGYDPSLNTRFSTYASYWIKQSIRRALINTARPIRLPAYMMELLNKWRAAAAQLQAALDRPPSEEEVAAHLDLSPKKLRIIRKAIRIHNAHHEGGQAEDGVSFEETLIDSRARPIDSQVAAADDLREVLGLLDELEGREARLLRLRFGLDGEEPKTLKEIGVCLGLTRERVRQIESEALGKLRERLAAG